MSNLEPNTGKPKLAACPYLANTFRDGRTNPQAGRIPVFSGDG